MSNIDNNRHYLYCVVVASLNISMPDELREFIERRTKENHMATPTEYIRSLIREDKKRAEQETLERLILDGIQSGDAIAVQDVDRYFAKKKQALLERLKSKAGRK